MSVFYSLREDQLRIERIWPLPNGNVPESMIEFVEGMQKLPDALIAAAGSATRHAALDSPLFNGPGDDECEEAWEELFGTLEWAGKTGFLAEVHRPVMKYRGDGVYSYSWGHYQISCFFGETIDSIVQQAIEWASITDASARAKAQGADHA